MVIIPEDQSLECAHHWVIDSPSGPTSRGVCKQCGAEGEFKNSLPDGTWERDSSQSNSSENPKVLVKPEQPEKPEQ